MPSKKPLTNPDGEVRELKDEDLSQAVPFSGLPETLHKKLKTRGPQKEPTKKAISIRLSREVVEYFKSTGTGWQSRIDDVLREYIEHK